MRTIDILALGLLVVVFAYSALSDFDAAPAPAPPVERAEIRRAMPPPAASPRRPLAPPSRTDPVVLVESGNEASDSVGTAFSLDSDGVWMTARHVVDGCDRVGLRTGPDRAVKVRSVWVSSDSDLAVLSDSLSRPALGFAGRLPDLGEEGYAVGFPKGEPGDVVGRLIGRAVSKSRGRLSLEEPILVWSEQARFPRFPGAMGGISGGPLLSADGQVMGVVLSATVRKGRFNTAARVSIDSALDQAPLTPDAEDKVVAFSTPIGRDNLPDWGGRLRQTGAVTQVICQVD